MNRIDLSKNRFEEYLKEVSSNFSTVDKLKDAMTYSLLAGGKRIRPLLVLSIGDFLNIPFEELLPMAASLEMIHTYSLIHDDLPAMDNDDLRRGKPTNHKVYGEAIAILAGDGLLNEALNHLLLAYGNEENGWKAVLKISENSGIKGMIKGQVLDMEGEGKDLTHEDLIKIHEGKTGALIKASIEAPGVLYGAEPSIMKDLEKIGSNLGMLFQIQDDILDYTSSSEKMGKTVGKDERDLKSTYVRILGLEEAIKIKDKLYEEIKTILEKFGKNSEFLRELIDSIYKREN